MFIANQNGPNADRLGQNRRDDVPSLIVQATDLHVDQQHRIGPVLAQGIDPIDDQTTLADGSQDPGKHALIGIGGHGKNRRFER